MSCHERSQIWAVWQKQDWILWVMDLQYVMRPGSGGWVKFTAFFGGRWLESYGRVSGCDAVLLQGLHMQHQQQITSPMCPFVGQKRVHSAGLQMWWVWAQRGGCMDLQPDLSQDRGAKTWQTWLEEIQGIWIHEVLLERGQGCQCCLAIWQSQCAEAGQWRPIAICLT